MLMIMSVARATSVLTEDRPSFHSMLYYYVQMLLFGKYLVDTVLCNGLHVTVLIDLLLRWKWNLWLYCYLTRLLLLFHPSLVSAH